MARFHKTSTEKIPFTIEEETQRDAEEKEWANQLPVREMESIREHRNRSLNEPDYYALSDVTMNDEMKTYRQALRDIPASNTVYKDVEWPDKP